MPIGITKRRVKTIIDDLYDDYERSITELSVGTESEKWRCRPYLASLALAIAELGKLEIELEREG